jgi:hypothetical protein
LGTLSFIKFNIIYLLKSTTCQIPNSICFACGWVSSKNPSSHFLLNLLNLVSFFKI